MDPTILVAYATKHTHTRLIAERIGAVLREAGAEVDLCDLGARHTNPHPAEYAGVVLAASIHAGHHQGAVERWARSHATTLGERPSAFVSVSLAAADDTDERAPARAR